MNFLAAVLIIDFAEGTFMSTQPWIIQLFEFQTVPLIDHFLLVSHCPLWVSLETKRETKSSVEVSVGGVQLRERERKVESTQESRARWVIDRAGPNYWSLRPFNCSRVLDLGWRRHDRRLQSRSRAGADARDAQALFSSWVCKVVVEGLAQIKEA